MFGQIETLLIILHLNLDIFWENPKGKQVDSILHDWVWALW